MKKTILILSVTVLLLSACTIVKFEASQPSGIAELKEFPTNFIGKYLNTDNDTLIITKTTYKIGNKKSIFYANDSISSGKITLKKNNDYYVLSQKSENTWDVITFKCIGDNLTGYYINLGNKDNKEETIKKLKEILTVKEIKNNDGNIDYYLINPTKEQFDILMKKEIFSKIVDFKRIK